MGEHAFALNGSSSAAFARDAAGEVGGHGVASVTEGAGGWLGWAGLERVPVGSWLTCS